VNDYQAEQFTTFELIRLHLPKIKEKLQQTQADHLEAYRSFRKDSDRYLDKYFSGICSLTCYQNRHSACCSKDGIITYFADMVINTLYSEKPALERIARRLRRTHLGMKCLYLGTDGCMWRIKPVVCQMFLCEHALKEVFFRHPRAKAQWGMLRQRRKDFTWPDKPVLFDAIESLFLSAGCTSPLMYLHNSPGLLRVKQKAGVP